MFHSFNSLKESAQLKGAMMICNGAELRSPMDSLPDQLINPEEYELPFHMNTPLRSQQKELGKAQRRLIPAYIH